jgi:hypothetical protein
MGVGALLLCQGVVFGRMGRSVNVEGLIRCGKTQTLKLRLRSRNVIAFVALDRPPKLTEQFKTPQRMFCNIQAP